MLVEARDATRVSNRPKFREIGYGMFVWLVIMHKGYIFPHLGICWFEGVKLIKRGEGGGIFQEKA